MRIGGNAGRVITGSVQVIRMKVRIAIDKKNGEPKLAVFITDVALDQNDAVALKNTRRPSAS